MRKVSLLAIFVLIANLTLTLSFIAPARAVSDTDSDTTTGQLTAPPIPKTRSKQKGTAPAPVTISIQNKSLELSDIAATISGKNAIDLTMKIKNSGKYDDAIVALETPLSEKASIVTTQKTKETEAPVKIDLPNGKTTTLAEKEKVIRISGIEKMPKDGEHIQITLHFRSAPNANLELAVHNKKSSSFFGF